MAKNSTNINKLLIYGRYRFLALDSYPHLCYLIPMFLHLRRVALRYLKIRKRDSAVFTIAMFSLVNIMLGVMTLIVVLSVMRGVHGEMIRSIIGLEGHVTVVSGDGPGIQNYPDYWMASASWKASSTPCCKAK